MGEIALLREGSVVDSQPREEAGIERPLKDSRYHRRRAI